MKMEITKVKIKLRNKAQRDNGGYYGGSAAPLLPSLSDYVTGDYLIENYVAKEAGKGLSANNFTDDLLTKLNGIEAGANKYEHPTATATTIPPAAGRVLSAIKVNSLGHVTSVSSKVLTASDIPTLGIAKITGLQDALDAKVAQSDFDTFKNLFDSMFEKVTENGVTSIKAKYGLWTESFLSCLGLNSSGSGGGGGSYNRLDNWADYAADKAGWVLSAKLGYDLWLNKADKSTVNAIASRVTTLEGKNYLDALTLVPSGSGNTVTGVSLSADKKTLNVNYGIRVAAVPSVNNVHFNNIATYGNAMGMVNLQSASALVNPNGQTGWHHFINVSYQVSGQETNMWQTQIANAAGTTDLWVRSRAGGTISDSTAWAAPWTRILTGTNYASVLDARYYTKSEVDTKDKRLTTYYAVRPTSANVNFGNAAGLYTFLATSVMTTGKPTVDSHILHMEWDNSLSYAAQLALPAGSDASMQWRWQHNTTWQAWRTLLDTNNYAGTLDTRYVTKDTAQTITGQKIFDSGRLVVKVPNACGLIFYSLGDSDTDRVAAIEILKADGSWLKNSLDFYKSGDIRARYNLTAASFIRSGGTSSQFLMADGSLTTKKTLSTVGNSGWTNQTADSLIVPTMSFIAYWDGSYSGGASNLRYCNKGAFGDIVTHSHSEYVTSIGILGDKLAYTKNGVADTLTIPYATTAARLVGTTEHTGTGLSNFDTTYTQTYQATNDLGDGISYMAILSVSAGSANRYFQIIGGKGDINYLRWRTTNGSGSALGPAHRILDDGNYPSVLDSRYYTESEADARFVNASGDTMTGALLAPRVEVGHMYWDGTGIMPSTAGHLQYYCGKADGRWANVFTRTINVTSTDLVSNLNADMLDGFHKESFDGYRHTQIDASALDNNTWYPVVFRVPQALQTRIRIEGGSAANASWNGRGDKRMSVVLDYTVQGSEWGWVTPQRVINLFILGAGASGSNCIAGLGQLTNNSWEYVMVRGGAVYNFYISHWLVPELKTSTFTNQSQSVSPTTTPPTAITRNNAWITDNVASATKLLNTRTLWGQSFNGTGNVDGSMTGVGSIQSSHGITSNVSDINTSVGSNAYWYGLGLSRGNNSNFVTLGGYYGLKLFTYSGMLAMLSNGNVGIGTTSPAYKLDVNGIVRASDSIISTGWNQFRAVGGNYGFFIRNDGNHTYFMLTNSGDAYGSYNSLRPMYIVNSSGVVGFASSTLMVDPDGYASVNGEFYASVGIYSDGFVSARGRDTSDVRLKTDLRDFRASDIIRALRPVAFRWNELARSRFKVFDTDAVQYGLIAQEVLETASWLVDTDMFRDGYMGVWYDKLIPVLLKGEIELLRVTDDHEERIKALERENEELRKEIIELQTK